MEPYGCAVFEVALKEDASGTLVHGEFYAAGSTIKMGKEWDLRFDSPLEGKIMRQEGYDAMTRLLESLESFSKPSGKSELPSYEPIAPIVIQNQTNETLLMSINDEYIRDIVPQSRNEKQESRTSWQIPR